MLSIIILIAAILMFIIFYAIQNYYHNFKVTPQSIGIGISVILTASLYPLLIYQGVKVFSHNDNQIKNIRKETSSFWNKYDNINSKIKNLKEDIDILSKDKKSNIEKINQIKKEKDKLSENQNKLKLKENELEKKIHGLRYSENITIFISLLIGGLIALVFGIIFKSSSQISIAAIGGGLISILWGYSQSWFVLSSKMIFVSILIAIIVLVTLLWWYGKKLKVKS